ncbi:MAG TPA: VanW family protein [Candidatus Sulfotelmatobacter sp.]|nr:VanW family protein [Candidatus Sulfotelmatobacter sp.]
MSPRHILFRGLGLGLLAASLLTGLFLGYVSWYTGTGRVLPGVSIGKTQVGGLTVPEARVRLAGGEVRRPAVLAGSAGTAGGAVVGAGGGGAPAPRAHLRYNGKSWELDLREVGALPDLAGALREAAAIGREGTLVRRASAYLAGIVHGYYVPDSPNINDDAIGKRLAEIAPEIAVPAVNATYHFESDTVTDAAAGLELDLPLSVQEVRRALRLGRREVDLAVRVVEPAVTKEDLAGSRRYQVARFTTPILAAEPGRVQNIAMAVRKISGTAMKPGQVFSFNDVVGPRDAEHGWAQANELYQGEFVRGYGGGICQVSSTLYNTVLLSGLEVKERYHHDRPLQYIEPGRDATVAWNVLDFKFRNNTDMLILIGARILPGSPQEIEVALYAPRQVPEGAITLEAADVRYYPPELEEIPDKTLKSHQRNVVDEGHYGIEVKMYRIFRTEGKERRELVSHDKYQPKAGKVRVGVGNAPGSERLLSPGLR